MTQQTIQPAVIPPVMLPYEISKAVLESTGSIKAIESIASGTLSGVDTQGERTTLINQIKTYFESGAINGAGLVIGVLLLIAGVYLLFLEFKESPRTNDLKRVSSAIKSRAKSGAKSGG